MDVSQIEVRTAPEVLSSQLEKNIAAFNGEITKWCLDDSGVFRRLTSPQDVKLIWRERNQDTKRTSGRYCNRY